MTKTEQLTSWIRESKRIVFFGGAGVSTESGVPDFRSAAGIYQSEQNSPYSPEEILSRSFFDRYPDIFFDFYKSKMLHPNAKPNPAHFLLAQLEQEGKLDAIITQNIDGLHQMAGSQHVLELHGSIHRNHCMKCGHDFNMNDVLNSTEVVPYCTVCDGIIKPDVVLYEEMLDENVMSQAVTAISKADLLLVGGTSLTVQPAAHFITYFRGNYMVLMNIATTPYDNQADLLINEPIGQVFDQVSKILTAN